MLPDSLEKVVVNFGPYLDASGVPLVGKVILIRAPVNLYYQPDEIVMTTTPVEVYTDATGSASVTLPATNADGLNVVDFTYEVGSKLFGNKLISLPKNVSPVAFDIMASSGCSNGIVVWEPSNSTLTVGIGTVETLPPGESPTVSVTDTATGVDLNFGFPSPNNAWGSLEGTLSAQTDLQAALDSKADTTSLGSAAFEDTTAFDAAGTAHNVNTLLSAHTSNKSNPHSVTASQVGLGNVNNTSDINKPVSTAQAAALALKVDKVEGKALSTNDYTTAEKTKLAGIEAGANNYIHPTSGITAGTYTKLTVDAKGHATEGAALAASDIPFLDASIITTGTISADRLPTYVTSVAGKSGVVTLAKADVGLANVDNTTDLLKPISTATAAALALKADASSLEAHVEDVDNPHSVTKAQVGLGNVDNTSDASKPVSVATAAALALKEDKSALGTAAYKDVEDFDAAGNSATVQAALEDHIEDKSNPHAVTAAQVGLGNVNNTSDAAKPISTATQAALSLKEDIANLKSAAYQESTDFDVAGAAAVVNAALEEHVADVDNPHNVTAQQLGLENVDNTADLDKPVSTAQAAAIATKLGATENAVSASKLATARTINGTSFDGTADITTTQWGAARTLTIGATGKSVNGSAGVSWSLAEILPASATAGYVLAAPASAAGAPTFRALTASDVPTLNQSTTGNAATATKLATARTIAATGDATWSVSFDGSGNATASMTLAASGVTAGSYGAAATIPVLTVDAKGRVTAASSVAAAPAWANITGKPTTVSGYGITDVAAIVNALLQSFGVGVTGQVSLLADIDAATTATGIYSISGTTTGTKPSEWTGDETASLLMLRYSSSWSMQLMIRRGDGTAGSIAALYSRSYNASTSVWTSWVRYATTDSVNALTTALAGKLANSGSKSVSGDTTFSDGVEYFNASRIRSQINPYSSVPTGFIDLPDEYRPTGRSSHVQHVNDGYTTSDYSLVSIYGTGGAWNRCSRIKGVRGGNSDADPAAPSVNQRGLLILDGLCANGTGYNQCAQIAFKSGTSLQSNTNASGQILANICLDGSTTLSLGWGIYDAGQFRSPFVYSTTTASAANVNVGSDGTLARSTSSLKYKTDIEDLQDSYGEEILSFRPIWYRSKCAGDNPNWSYYGFGAEEVAAIDPRYVFWAYPKKTVEVTETDEVEVPTGDVGEDGVPVMRTETRTVTRTEQVDDTDQPMQPEGVMYERLVVPLIHIAKKHRTRIEALEAQNAALAQQLADLAARVTALEGAA